MRNLLALVGLAVVVFGGLGGYLGWYKVSRQPSTNGEVNLGVNVNTKKIKEDANTAVERSGELIRDLRKGKNNETNPEFVGPPSSGQTLPPASLPGPFNTSFRPRTTQPLAGNLLPPIDAPTNRNNNVPSDPEYVRPRSR